MDSPFPRFFPVQGGTSVEWGTALIAYENYLSMGYKETLENIAKRGGFHQVELDALLSGNLDHMRLVFNWYANVLIRN